MSEPPLVNSSPNPATRRLLEAGLSDEPPPQVRPAVAAALGVSVSATASSSSGLARVEVRSQPNPPSLGAATHGDGDARPAPSRLLGGTAKWFVAGALLGVVVSAVLLAARGSPHRGETVASAPARRAPSPGAPPASPVAPGTPAHSAAAPSPSASALGPRAARSAASAPNRAFDIDIDAARERAVRQALGVTTPEPPTEGSARPSPQPSAR